MSDAVKQHTVRPMPPRKGWQRKAKNGVPNKYILIFTEQKFESVTRTKATFIFMRQTNKRAFARTHQSHCRFLAALFAVSLYVCVCVSVSVYDVIQRYCVVTMNGPCTRVYMIIIMITCIQMHFSSQPMIFIFSKEHS